MISGARSDELDLISNIHKAEQEEKRDHLTEEDFTEDAKHISHRTNMILSPKGRRRYRLL